MRWYPAWILVATLAVPLNLVAQNYWIPLTRPTDKDLHRVVFLDSLTGWTVGDGGTILKTTNGAQSWIAQNSKITSNIIDIFMLDPLRGWALSQTLPGGGWFGTLILRTTDGGTSWSNQQYPDTGQYMYSICFLDSLHGWLGGEYGRMVGTSDGGQTWFPAIVDTTLPYAIRRVKFHSPSYGIAVGGVRDITGAIWTTTTGGQAWSARPIGAEPLFDLWFNDSLNVVGVGGDFEFGSTVVKTTDGGANWDYIIVGYFGVGGGVGFRTAAEGWSPLGFSGTMMYTLDSGQTWTAMDVPNRSYVYDVAFTDDRNGFMVGSAGEVLKYNPIVGVQRDPGPGVPSNTTLYQNYPNPFNPETHIRFQIADRRWVRIRIYDLLGRDVAVLVNEMTGPGSYVVRWNSGVYPAGIYFCRLEARQTDGGQAGTQQETRKMILLK